jgi:hypothetical protein
VLRMFTKSKKKYRIEINNKGIMRIGENG